MIPKYLTVYFPELPESQLSFQHDGAPAHRAMIVKSWLVRKKIEVLKWPAQSLDLNIIEDCWNRMKFRLGGKTYPDVFFESSDSALLII